MCEAYTVGIGIEYYLIARVIDKFYIKNYKTLEELRKAFESFTREEMK